MKLQVLVIFVLFVRSSSAQDIECIYKDSLNAGTWYYTCELVIQNPNGFNNFTTIIGTHLPNRTDADVLRVHTHYQSKSTIFPQILCSQFKNLVQVHMNVLRLERINEESFRNCFNLQQLLLPYNYIENIHEQAFSRNTKLKVLNLNSNFITSLPDELFDNLVNLEELDISYNTLEIIPDGLFKGLKNLIFLNMEANNLKALNPVWFENVTNLEALIIARNNLTVISEQIFSKLKNLWGLDISRNAIGNNLAANAFKELRNLTFLYMESIQITQISNKLFESLKNLMELYMSGNLIDLIPEGTFDNLISLTSLDIGGCQLTEYNIPGNLFNKMSQLSYLNMNMNQIQTLNIQWFQNLFKLTSLGLNQNQINEIPIGIFSSISNLEGINLSNNYLKVISRNAFGNVSNLENVMFNGNLIRAIDEKFLKETNRLIYFSVLDNLCIDKFFYNFGIELEYNLPLLRECTSNFKLVVETDTEQEQAFRFYSAPTPGIQLSVYTNQEIRIALTSFSFLWTPSIEVLIGTRNNTLSTIIMNQNQEVAVANSPNIINSGQWTRLRITWANHLILVTFEGQDFPFLGFNMQDIFSVNFYGLRSPLSHAIWRVQPINW